MTEATNNASGPDNLRARFDEIEREIMDGKHDAESVFTQMRTAALYTAPPADNQGTTGDKYRAELYDEVWQKARDMGYGNVTEALVALERLRDAPPAAAVVMPEPDEIHQMAFEDGQPAENGDGYLFTAEEFDLFVERLLARLNSDHVEHVRAMVVPDVLAQCPKCPDGQNPDESYASGWNECLKYLQDLARLNPAPVEQSAMVVPEGYVLLPAELVEQVKHARKMLGSEKAPLWERQRLAQKLTDLLAAPTPEQPAKEVL